MLAGGSCAARREGSSPSSRNVLDRINNDNSNFEPTRDDGSHSMGGK